MIFPHRNTVMLSRHWERSFAEPDSGIVNSGGGGMISVNTRTQTQTRPKSLREVRTEVEAKRAADVIRFRTCCADPRASK
jgi:hypothetical protein